MDPTWNGVSAAGIDIESQEDQSTGTPSSACILGVSLTSDGCRCRKDN